MKQPLIIVGAIVLGAFVAYIGILLFGLAVTRNFLG